MPDWKKLLEQAKVIFAKLDTKMKMVLGGVLAVFVIALLVVGNLSSGKGQVVLHKGLNAPDFAKITEKLTELGYGYTSSGTSTIFVGPKQRQEIIVKLAQENLIPVGIQGWELFDSNEWTSTQFEKDVKLRRAITGELARSLETIRSIDKAKINVAFPPDELFTENVKPVTAAVLITYAPGVERMSIKEIRGIETLIARSIPGLKKENISIAGPDGELLNDYDNEVEAKKWELKEVEHKLKIQEKERIKLLSDIRKTFDSFYTNDRYDIVRLDLRLRWDSEEIEKNEVSPVIMEPDNPNTPYSERKVQDSLEVSSKKTTETFEGNGFTPEGPAGTEPNIPPGYKDKDYQKAKYQKTENIKNNEFNKTHRKIKKQPWQIEQMNLAIILDGRWKKLGEKLDPVVGWHYMREYKEVSEEEKRKVTDLLKSSLGLSAARGDKISVQEIQKDRTKQFNVEDEELRSAKALKKMLLVVLVSLLVLALAFVIYQVIKREMERRRRLREEELAAQQQMMREAALRAIEEEGVEVEMSLEERARKEMLENAINLAKERPEDVAHLLRTWLADE